MNTESAEWLNAEDASCFDDRLSRLHWVAENAPRAEYWTFHGGLISKSLFEETRYCFVYGQFLAATLLGLAYIEHTLAALFYASGRNDLKRAGFAKLIAEAHSANLIDAKELENLQRIGAKRNAYAHFRTPGHNDGIERRSIGEDEAPYLIIEKDAVDVLAAALRMVAKTSI